MHTPSIAPTGHFKVDSIVLYYPDYLRKTGHAVRDPHKACIVGFSQDSKRALLRIDGITKLYWVDTGDLRLLEDEMVRRLCE